MGKFTANQAVESTTVPPHVLRTSSGALRAINISMMSSRPRAEAQWSAVMLSPSFDTGSTPIKPANGSGDDHVVDARTAAHQRVGGVAITERQRRQNR